MSVLSSLRRAWLEVHLWLGIGLLIPFLVLGVTGSLLIWHEDFERALEPQRYAVSSGPSRPLAEQVRAAQTALGRDFIVNQVRPPEHEGEPTLVQARAKAKPPEGQRPATRTAWVDPASVLVLDTADPRAGVFGVMHNLHGSFMIPQTGRKIVGFMGWGMFVSALTGLWLWWPRNGAFFAGLAWRRSPRTTANLHHFAGFWLCIPLALLAFTGIYISFPIMSRSLVAPMVGEQVEAQAPQAPGGGPPPLTHTNLTIDAAFAAAERALPDARVYSIALPARAREGNPSWRVTAAPEGANAFTMMRTIQVDDETGRARIGRPASEVQGVALVMRRLHDGVDLGPVWQTILFLAGWGPALFGFTGIIMWLRRRKAKAALRA
jgi:uncharacterized iron-regulated membrane protein